MTEVERPDPEHPLILNPKDFLVKPFERIEIGILAALPNIDFLRWLPTIKRETGLVLQHPKWYVIKASEIGIPRFLLPHSSDTLLHSHPFHEEDKLSQGALPSIGDFVNCSPTAKNLIASSLGITQYWYIKDEAKRKNMEAELLGFFPRFSDGKNLFAYLKFLETSDARYEIYPWSSINEQGLKELLYS